MLSSIISSVLIVIIIPILNKLRLHRECLLIILITPYSNLILETNYNKKKQRKYLAFSIWQTSILSILDFIQVGIETAAASFLAISVDAERLHVSHR